MFPFNFHKPHVNMKYFCLARLFSVQQPAFIFGCVDFYVAFLIKQLNAMNFQKYTFIEKVIASHLAKRMAILRVHAR